MGQGDGERAATGVPGMDEVLRGGMLPGRLYVLRGVPGVGKTTFGLQFLLEGARRGERLLYLSFSQTKQNLLQIAQSHRWSLERVALYAADDNPERPQGQTIFPSAAVELMEQLRQLNDAVEDAAPARAVLDVAAALYAAYAQTPALQQGMRALKTWFVRKDAVALLLDDRRAAASDACLDELADGVIAMTQNTRSVGGVRRRLQILKVQGASFEEGRHDYRISTGGLTVFPRLVAARYRCERQPQTVSSGSASLDELFGGGLDRGGCVLLLGPCGTGKSSVAMQISAAAAERGEAVSIYLFDESVHTFLLRADGLSMALRSHVKTGRIRITPLEPGESTPGELADSVRRLVETGGVQLVVLDSVRGYHDAMLEEQPSLVRHLRELVAYLRERAVVTVIVASHAGSTPASAESRLDLDLLGDAVLLFRRYQHAGRIRTAVSALKRRASAHPRVVRDLTLGPSGISLAPMPAASDAAALP